MEQTEFPHPYLTVDVLIFSIINNELSILLIKRSNTPFQGSFALPGSFVSVDESISDAAKRALATKGHLENAYLEQLYTFGEINRDPRGRVVSVAYIALVAKDKVEEIDDGRHVIKWFPVTNLPALAFDHKEIIKVGIERLKGKISYTSIAVGLLPKSFRLSELQKVYEIILGKLIDKRNFRKKMLSLDLLEDAGKIEKGHSHRPAKLYQFKNKNPIVFD